MSSQKLKELDRAVLGRTLASPSILAGDFGRLAESAALAEKAGADLIHVDVMDGHFVPNITIGPDAVAALKKAVSIPLDVHLMISRPDRYAKRFIEAGADMLTVHKESEHDMKKTLAEIKNLGCRRGAVINPDTDVATIEDILPECDMVLVMSVFPGFGGQSFISGVLSKVTELKEIREKKKYSYWIEIDGGIGRETAAQAFVAGADVIVAGTYVFRSRDMKDAVASLKIPRHE